MRPGETETRRERWLEYHERFTNGLPGLLPLVLDLPVRFTDSPDPRAKELGIFKFTRGVCRGWELEDEEQARIAELGHASEVVLQRRPRVIYIEVPTANDKLLTQNNRKIYCLKLCVKTWSLDRDGQVHVRRHGFPIVPDFGGTAHAYCGSTLQAALGDLLPWWHKPRLDDMLKGYIIKVE